MKTVLGTVIFAFVLAFSPAALAGDVHVHIIVGQSNAYGREMPFTAQAIDREIALFPELGVMLETEPDLTQREYPPGRLPELPRWQQDIDRRPLQLGPVTNAGNTRWGVDVLFGRMAHIDLQRTATPGSITIVKFAHGASSLNRHWINSKSIDLVDRLLMMLYQVKTRIEAGGDTVRWRSLSVLQGEGDAKIREDAVAFAAALRILIGKVRGFTQTPALPVVIVQTDIDVAYIPANRREEKARLLAIVKAAQAQVAREDPKAALVRTGDLVHADAYHFRDDQYSIIARRMFSEWRKLR